MGIAAYSPDGMGSESIYWSLHIYMYQTDGKNASTLGSF